MAVLRVCLLNATVHSVFAAEISDMELSSSMLLERFEALEDKCESQRLPIADLVIKTKLMKGKNQSKIRSLRRLGKGNHGLNKTVNRKRRFEAASKRHRNRPRSNRLGSSYHH